MRSKLLLTTSSRHLLLPGSALLLSAITTVLSRWLSALPISSPLFLNPCPGAWLCKSPFYTERSASSWGFAEGSPGGQLGWEKASQGNLPGTGRGPGCGSRCLTFPSPATVCCHIASRFSSQRRCQTNSPTSWILLHQACSAEMLLLQHIYMSLCHFLLPTLWMEGKR